MFDNLAVVQNVNMSSSKSHLRCNATVNGVGVKPVRQASVMLFRIAPPLPTGLSQKAEGCLLGAGVCQFDRCWPALLLHKETNSIC